MLITTDNDRTHARHYLSHMAHQLEAPILRTWCSDEAIAGGAAYSRPWDRSREAEEAYHAVQAAILRASVEDLPLIGWVIDEIAVGYASGAVNLCHPAPVTYGVGLVPAVSERRGALTWIESVDVHVFEIGGSEYSYSARRLSLLAEDEILRLSCSLRVNMILVSEEIFALAHRSPRLPHSALRMMAVAWPVNPPAAVAPQDLS